MIRKLLRNFWFCLMIAVLSLLTLSSAVLEGSTFWIALGVFNVVYWVFAAYRTTKPQQAEVVLTDEQTHRITVITRRFKHELDEIIEEAKDNEPNNNEPNNGKDKETDKKQSDDE